MARKYADLVKQYSTSVGTGAIALSGTPTGFLTFASALSPGDTFYYTIQNLDRPTEVEAGVGTYQANGTITRAPSTPPVNFSAGKKSVSLTAGAALFTSMQTLVDNPGALQGPAGPAGVSISNTAPTDHSILWVDTSVSPAVLKFYSSTSWIALASGGAGTTSTLATLSLTANTITENSAAGTVVGSVQNLSAGSSLALTNNAGGRFSLIQSGSLYSIVAGATNTDYEGTPSNSITLTETLAGAVGSPKVTTLTIATANLNDTNPTAFSFSALSGAALNSVQTSNSITIAGLGASDSATAAVSGSASGQLQKNGGAWVSGPVTVVNGDTLAVRHTSAPSNSTAVTTTLTVGTTAATFTSTTLAAATLGTNLLLGFNVTSTSYDSVNRIESDYGFGAAPASLPSGNESTVRDAQGWPTAPNSGDTKVRHIFRNPETAGKQILVSYTPNTGSTITLFNCTLVSAANDAAGTITVAPNDVQPTATGWALDFTPGTSMPKIISAKEVGDNSTLAATFLTHMALAPSGAPIRTMKATPNNEANDGVIVSQTSQAFPAPVITAANRNTLASGDWCYNYSSGIRNDTRPFEADLQAARLTTNATWRAMSWNVSDDYIDALGDAAAAAALNYGTTSYFEVSNEDWNGGYPSFSQARYEAIKKAFLGTGLPPFDGAPSNNVIVVNGTISGTTLTINSTTFGSTANILPGMGVFGDPPMGFSAQISSGSGNTWTLTSAPGNVTGVPIAINTGLQLERHVDKTIDVMDRLKARFVAAGAPLSKLKRVFAWQNSQMSTYFAGHVLDYAPTGKTALKNHIDVLSSAPYLMADYVAGGTIQVPNSSTNPTAFLNAMTADIDEQIDTHVRQAYVEATARGLTYACYEFGPSPYIDDATTRTAVHHGSGMYDLMMHVFARMEGAAPGSAICNFALPHIDYANQSFGILQYSGQTIDSTTPKYNAQRDFVAGIRRLQSLNRTSAAPAVVAGAAAGTVVATYSRATEGSTVTVSDARLVAVKRANTSLVDIKVATGATFPTNGTSAFTITETDSRDTRGHLDTTDTLTISGNAAGTHWDATSANYSYSTDFLTATSQSGAAIVKANKARSSGDFSVTITMGAGGDCGVGFSFVGGAGGWAGDTGNVGWFSGGTVYVNGAGVANLGSYTTSDVIKALYSSSAHTVQFYKNGVAVGSPVSVSSIDSGGSATPIASTSGVGYVFAANFTNWP